MLYAIRGVREAGWISCFNLALGYKEVGVGDDSCNEDPGWLWGMGVQILTRNGGVSDKFIKGGGVGDLNCHGMTHGST